MGWTEVVPDPEGRRYVVAVVPTGSIRVGAVPGTAPAGQVLGGIDGIVGTWLFGGIVNALFFRGQRTVLARPWPGTGRRWYRERLDSNEAAVTRAQELVVAIEAGRWTPSRRAAAPA